MAIGDHRAVSRSRPTLAAIVPATDRPSDLDRCLAAIRDAPEPPEELLRSPIPRRGRARGGAQPGAVQLGADVLVFVDCRRLVHPRRLLPLRGAFAADPELRLFGSYDDAPEAAGTRSRRFRNLLHHHVHQRGAGRATTFWAVSRVRREAFLEVRGFDRSSS